MATQTHPSQRKIRWSAPAPTQPLCPPAQPYRRRRPENTTLHRIVREHLETYLAQAEEADPMGDGVPTHVENEFRSYLKCGKRLRPFLHHRPKTATAVLHILLRALLATLKEACPTAPATASMGAVSFLHRFGSSLNPHFHYHLCVVDGLFERSGIDPDQSPETRNDGLRFHEATALTPQLLERLQHTIRKRILRHFRRHSLLEPHEAEDMLTWDHGGGFSLDASVHIEAHDRAGLERLIRYCARPPFALERLHLAGGRSDQVLYILPAPDLAGRTALRLSALEFLDRLAAILPPPRIHRHRYQGAFAPNAPLRSLVTARAHQDNADAAQNAVPDLPIPAPPPPMASPPKSENPEPQPPDNGPSRPSPWAALLARIYEVFPLICPACGTALTFISFLTDPVPITRILAHIGEPTSPPILHPARAPPQAEFDLGESHPEEMPEEMPEETDLVSVTDGIDQSPPYDPAEPEPVPEDDDFDQTRGW